MPWLDIVQEVYDMCIIGNSSSQKGIKIPPTGLAIKQKTVDKSGVLFLIRKEGYIKPTIEIA